LTLLGKNINATGNGGINNVIVGTTATIASTG
jgi:hypothetical protein